MAGDHSEDNIILRYSELTVEEKRKLLDPAFDGVIRRNGILVLIADNRTTSFLKSSTWAEGVYDEYTTDVLANGEEAGFVGDVPLLDDDEIRKEDTQKSWNTSPVRKYVEELPLTKKVYGWDEGGEWELKPIGVEELEKYIKAYTDNYEAFQAETLKAVFGDLPPYVPVVLPLHVRIWRGVTSPVRRLARALWRARMAFHDDDYDGFSGYDRGW